MAGLHRLFRPTDRARRLKACAFPVHFPASREIRTETGPGHDQRYAIDATRITHELGWRPVESFESGLTKTVIWYMENRSWWERVRSGVYRGERLGTGVVA